MKIHEYQAKEILRRHKANVPFGVVVDKKENASKAHDEVTSKTGGSVVVVKAQIHAGGREKAAGSK